MPEIPNEKVIGTSVGVKDTTIQAVDWQFLVKVLNDKNKKNAIYMVQGIAGVPPTESRKYYNYPTILI